MLELKRLTLIGGVTIGVVGILIGGVYLIQQEEQEIIVVVPELSPKAKTGIAAFETYCVECHGENAAGTKKGPSLIHSIYRPSHHSDFSFVRAITVGVAQHHWLFGSMPPQPQLVREEIDQIIVYVRELQRANGIQ
jgi:mono/diheme cytochrome c family protein